MTAPPSYVCPSCGSTSYHTADIRERYCGHCHLFYDQARKCDCGEPLHYVRRESMLAVQEQVRTLGRNITVTVPGHGVFSVPRHYVALHGITAKDLPTLAHVYNWAHSERTTGKEQS